MITHQNKTEIYPPTLADVVSYHEYHKHQFWSSQTRYSD